MGEGMEIVSIEGYFEKFYSKGKQRREAVGCRSVWHSREVSS
jgi:hypothetical protein